NNMSLSARGLGDRPVASNLTSTNLSMGLAVHSTDRTSGSAGRTGGEKVQAARSFLARASSARHSIAAAEMRRKLHVEMINGTRQRLALIVRSLGWISSF